MRESILRKTGCFPEYLSVRSVTQNTAQISGFTREVFDFGASPTENAIALTGGIFAGMSGGPILNSGKVVGVIVRGPSLNDRTISPTAVKAVHLSELIANTSRIPKT